MPDSISPCPHVRGQTGENQQGRHLEGWLLCAAGPYKDTVNLPDTKFNMRANSVKREPELQRQWAAQRTYETLRDANKGVHVDCSDLLCPAN